MFSDEETWMINKYSFKYTSNFFSAMHCGLYLPYSEHQCTMEVAEILGTFPGHWILEL